MRRALTFLLALATLGTGCGRSEDLEQRLVGLMNASQQSIVQYIYTETIEGRKTEVRGKIEDSLRHSESLLIDDAMVMDRVVHDDLMAVHVLVPDKVPQLASPDPADSGVVQALQAGQWVIDPAGAPAEAAAGESSQNVGVDPFKDGTDVFQYSRQAISQGAAVTEFNPDAIDYLKEDDPFPPPNRKFREARFDLRPPQLPRSRDEELPGPPPFRKMAFYIRNNRIARILEQIDIEGQADVKRAHETGRNPFLLQLAREVKIGRSSQPVRERTMSFDIVSGKDLVLDVPQQGLVGNLRVLFGERKGATQGQPGLPPGLPIPGAPGGASASPAP